MSIESLKEQARKHEQKEEWQKALQQYAKAIAKLEADDQPDIGLYNRVGDLHVRVGDLDDAVHHYEKSVDLYMDAFLPNNAIAVLKKIIRNAPEHHRAYLKMGQIRAEQGFLPDARTNFLTYAERMQQAGDLDESFRALVEFCDLAPDETDMRVMVAEQMASRDHVPEAVEQLSVAYRHMMAKGDSGAGALESRIRELDPSADLAASAPDLAMAGADAGGGDDMFLTDHDALGGFEEIGVGGDEPEEAAEEPAVEVEVGEVEIGGFELDTGDDEAEEEAVELPTFDMGDEDEEEAVELPSFDMGDEDEEEAVELPTFDVGEEAEEEPLPTFDMGAEAEEEPLPTFDMGAEAEEALEEAMEEAAADAPAAAADEALTLDDVRAQIGANPGDVALRQRMVELAYGTGDDSVLAEAFLGLAQTLEEAGEATRAQAAYQQVLDADPGNEAAKAALAEGGASVPVREVAANEDYVDLGSMILGEEEEKTTRFKVAYEEPSGDEAADFAKMLSQFKEKVSENLDADDVKAHYDLGTAYKEMGLLDEAVSEFQAALRASADHLPTYEMLGQTFMEMGKPEAALKSLQRAIDVEHDIEDELLGIYYYLARVHEDLGNTAEAVDYYDKVFALDINFADVTERLRALR